MAYPIPALPAAGIYKLTKNHYHHPQHKTGGPTHMVSLSPTGAYLLNGTEIIPDAPDALSAIAAKTGKHITKEEACKGTIAYGILESHNTSGNMDKLKIKFDKLTSHDITFVGIIQTARASGLEKFPIPYVLTNCHNSLCAVGGTINEDDHMFGLTCAKKYGGVYVPPHQAVIHQFAREMLAGGGKMILGSDSHTRYGALGTMAMGEGGPELVKQLLNQTYDVNMPGVVAVYLTGAPIPGVGPQDVALAIIGAVFANGYVKSIREAFDRYIGDHAKYYVPREKIDPREAVKVILLAGGIPVLAHPVLYHLTKKQLSELVSMLKEAGLIGIEAVYSTYAPSDEREIKALAKEYDLAISGGSDYHGVVKPGLEMGTGYGKLFVPEDVLDILRLKKKQAGNE